MEDSLFITFNTYLFEKKKITGRAFVVRKSNITVLDLKEILSKQHLHYKQKLFDIGYTS